MDPHRPMPAVGLLVLSLTPDGPVPDAGGGYAMEEGTRVDSGADFYQPNPASLGRARASRPMP